MTKNDIIDLGIKVITFQGIFDLLSLEEQKLFAERRKQQMEEFSVYAKEIDDAISSEAEALEEKIIETANILLNDIDSIIRANFGNESN